MICLQQWTSLEVSEEGNHRNIVHNIKKLKTTNGEMVVFCHHYGASKHQATIMTALCTLTRKNGWKMCIGGKLEGTVMTF
jgi:hypothetical protein